MIKQINFMAHYLQDYNITHQALKNIPTSFPQNNIS